MGKKSKIILGLAVGAMIPAMLTGCGHKHEYGTTLKSNETQHYYECSCGEKKDVENHEEAALYSHNETHHWKDCVDCGYDLVLEQHNFNQEVATSDYLKTAATATTKAVYYKSCVCGKAGTETFETDKTTATITNLAISGKTYDGTAVTAPTFDKNTDGTAVIEYKLKSADDNTYTTTAPIDAGEYTVRVKTPETTTYTAGEKTVDFTISPKVIDSNLFYSFTYNGDTTHYQEVPANELVERDKDLELWFDFYFDGYNAGSAIERIEISNDANQINPNYVVGDSVGAEIIKKGLEGSSVHLDIQYGDLKEYEAGVYYYDYTLTSEDGYGLIGDDEVTVRFFYSGINAGTVSTGFEMLDSNNYFDNDMGFNNTAVSAKVLEFPELIISGCNGSGIVIYEFAENDLGEVVTVQFTAKNGNNVVDVSGKYMGIKTAEDFVFSVGANTTENYCFDVSGDDYLNLFFIGEAITFANDVAGQQSNAISMEDFPNGGLFPLIVKGGMYSVSFSDNFGQVSGIYNEYGDKVSLDSTLTRGVYYLWITTPATPTDSDSFWVEKTQNEIKMLSNLQLKTTDLNTTNGVVVRLTTEDGIYEGDELTFTIDFSLLTSLEDWKVGETFQLVESDADAGNGCLVATVGGANIDGYMIEWSNITITIVHGEPDIRGFCSGDGCDEYLGTTTYSVNELIMGMEIKKGETVYLRFELDTEDNPMYNLKFQTPGGINYLEMPSNLAVKAYLDPESATGDNPIALNLTAKEFATSQYMYISFTATETMTYNIMLEETF